MSRRGFSLIEVLAVMAIVAILASLALPAWRGIVNRAGRLDATSALMAMGAAQERYRFVYQAYATSAGEAPPAGIGFDMSERGWYAIAIVRADATTFLAEARPVSDSPQVHDTLCQIFSIDETGRRGASPGSVEDCWP